VADPVSTVVSLLEADSAVSALVGPNVFGGELPRSDPPTMPQKAVVVVPSAGPSNLGGGWLPFNDFRVDVICYGATPFEAYGVWDVVVPALTDALKHDRVHWARTAAGPIQYRDPATDWPIARGSFQVLANQP